MVWVRHKYLASHLYVTIDITDFDHSRFHIQLSMIVFDGITGHFKIQQKISQWLISLLCCGFAIEMFIYHLLRFLKFIFKDKPLYLFKITVCLRIVVIVRPAGPEGRFI